VLVELELRRLHDLLELIEARGTCDRRGDAGASDEPGEGHLARLRPITRRHPVERSKDARPTLVEIFLHPRAARPGGDVGLRAVLAGEKAAGQGIVTDDADIL